MDSTIPPHPLQRLATRNTLKGDVQVEEWLIQWDNQTASKATWADAFAIQTAFPTFGLEDKPNFQVPVIDRDQPNTHTRPAEESRPWKVYSRRKKVGTNVG
ncbi:hypothetical protein LXL04_002395 [Taraxacum kok-saghyz]